MLSGYIGSQGYQDEEVRKWEGGVSPRGKLNEIGRWAEKIASRVTDVGEARLQWESDMANTERQRVEHTPRHTSGAALQGPPS
jgi:hypothetical protein